jgi:hypothetical protein
VAAAFGIISQQQHSAAAFRSSIQHHHSEAFNNIQQHQ